jgi:release factor glutamine methyltransferase
MKTLIEVLQAATDYLAAKGVENPRLVMEQWMSHVLKCPRLQLYLRFETPLPETQLEPLRRGVRRLAAGEPLQYVMGDTEFMGRRFATDRRALIPRPDTERLVEVVLAEESLWARPVPVIADVGTGSGCVIITLALARPGARYLAVDASDDALALARQNAEALGAAPALEFRHGDLLEAMTPRSLDAVVANLPYIPSGACAALPRHIRDHEPPGALDGGPDGLTLIRRLIAQAAAALAPGGTLFLEIGFDQAPAVVECLKQHEFDGVRVHPDLGGRDRVVRAVTQPGRRDDRSEER